MGDPDFDALVADLGSTSAAFGALWAKHEVRAKTRGTKRFNGPLGVFTLEWFSALSPAGSSQRMSFYRPEGGPDSENAKRLTAQLK